MDGKKIQKGPLRANSDQLFGFFRYCRREYFDTLKSFCYFWALDMAPTWAGSGLLLVDIDQLNFFRVQIRSIREISKKKTKSE